MPHDAHEPIDPKRYPNLYALQQLDREEHIQAALAMGLSRKEAIHHAESELAEAAQEGVVRGKARKSGR